MEDKNIQKYNELEEEFFSTSSSWTYNWNINNVRYCLDWDFDNKKYNYYINDKYHRSFKDVYEALDEIVINKKTLRQLILDTDFNFDYIN